jgi:spoIIIJ-associated protein
MTKNEKLIKSTIEELLGLLEIEGDFEVKTDEEKIDINLNTKDSGMVIGYHGDTLESLQLVFALCLSKKTGEFKRVSIEVGEYKKNRAEWLKNLAEQTKERALAEEREVPLYDLKGWERREIHLLLQDDKEVLSESTGEGKDRVLVIKPKK